MAGEDNAFRHAIWQAAITNRFGFSTTEEAANAHEDDPLPNLAARSFPKMEENPGQVPIQADTLIDLLNNPIGRFVGGTSPQGTGMRTLAEKVLDHFHERGLWVAVPNGNTWAVKKQTLSDEKYQKLRSALQRKDDNGEWKN